MVEKKRARPASAAVEKQTKRQRNRAALAAKPTYHKPKPSNPLIDTPLEDLLPHQRIDLIAELSESILEDPQSAVSSSRTTLTNSSESEHQYQKTQSKLQKLIELSSPSTNGHDATSARLGLLSLLAIFTDILPSYRIRLPTESEMAVRVSKEIKQTWDYERKLLMYYQRYLQLLEGMWEKGRHGSGLDGTKNGSPTTLAATSILCLSQLLQTCYNFNFRTNLLQIVVRQGNHQLEEVRGSCCNALRVMFAKDVQGEASLEAVKRMAKMVKEQRGRVHCDLLNTWMSLPLRVHEDEAMAAKIATKVKNKRSKKSQQEKDMAEIEKELKEGDAVVDKLDLAKNQADILHSVTLSYFRILKDCGSEGDKKGNDLLPVCLRGLAKFSHLIHMDAIVDLMDVLKELLKDSQNLPLDTAIHCILCALKTLKGPGRDTLPVDPKEYLIPLYNELSRLGIYDYQSTADPSWNEHSTDQNGSNMDKSVEAAIQCIDHAFTQRRELSASRLAAFLKRIVSTTLHCPPHSSAPLLASARQIALRYASSSKVQRMLENEEDIVAEGMYAPNAEDPEHSNAHTVSLWDLTLLRFHINPTVAEHATGMAENKFLKLPGESPLSIGADMGRNAKEGYIAHRVEMKKHPLDGSKAAIGKRQRRNQGQVRFITPRKTGQWHLLPANSVLML